MGLIKYLQKLKVPASLFYPVLIYLLFIILVINITFPLKIQTNTQHLEVVDKKQNKEYVNHQGKGQPKAVIVSSSANDGTNLLKQTFKKADLDNDNQLNVHELARYINTQTRNHINTAIQTNPLVFAQIDKSPQDGLISWNEYHVHFLREHYIPADQIDANQHVKMDRKLKETLMRDKAHWSEAARTDPESLTLDEFLSFRHPESSAGNLVGMIDDLLRQFDMDGDDQLTFAEFTNEDEESLDTMKKTMHLESVIKKQEEFTRLIDKNKDGKADRGELLSYIDPRNPRHALQEAATLFSLADGDKNGFLTLAEVLLKPDLFLSSKMIGTSESFHDDF